jgi:hypothetical protein
VRVLQVAPSLKASVPLKAVPLQFVCTAFDGANEATGTKGEANQKSVPCGTACTVAAAADFGHDPATSKALVKIGKTDKTLSTAEEFLAEGDAKATLTSAKQITASAMQSGTSVTVGT